MDQGKYSRMIENIVLSEILIQEHMIITQSVDLTIVTITKS